MHITFVKKILADGTPCRKCQDVEARLKAGGHWSRIDAICIADERDPDSEGWTFAREFKVNVAPFFVVRDRGTTKAYTIYLQFVREVLERAEAVSQLG